VDADGSSLRRLTEHAYNEYAFAWSPDGRTILYGREDRLGIYVIGANGSNDHKVTSDSPAPIAWGALAWAPDGRAIAYATDRTGNGDLYVIGADGRNKLRLTRSADSDLAPSWAPG
jgi:TolB protein